MTLLAEVSAEDDELDDDEEDEEDEPSCTAGSPGGLAADAGKLTATYDGAPSSFSSCDAGLCVK